MSQKEQPEINKGSADFNLEEARRRAAELKMKLEAAAQAKALDIEKKAKSLEEIFRQGLEIQQQLKEAQEIRDYFQSQEEKGLLTPEDQDSFEQVKDLVAGLEKQQEDLKASSVSITQEKEVRGKVEEKAYAEDVERSIKQLEEKGKKEIGPIYEEIKKEVDIYLKKRQGMSDGLENLNKTIYKEREEIEKLLGVVSDGTHSLSRIDRKIRSAWNERSGHPQGWFISQVEELRQGLGFFQRKEGKALDRLLDKRQIFEECEINERSYQSNYQLSNDYSHELEPVVELMRKAYGVADKIDGEIKKMGDHSNLRRNAIDYPLDEFLDKKVKPYSEHHRITEAIKEKLGEGSEEERKLKELEEF